MNIKEILEEMLSRDPENGNVRNIIFWYDADQEFVNDIEGLTFENTKVVVLSNNNAFKVKYDVEVADLSSHFLIYAPFGKPLDRENWLLDIQKYSEEFSTDRSIYEMRRLGITDDTLRPLVKQSIKFFENEKRVNKLKSFGIEAYDQVTFEVAIVSALAKLKTADFDELVRLLITEHDSGDEKLIEDIQKYSNLEAFYELVIKRFGYNSEVMNMDEFIGMLFYTSFAYEFSGKLPKDLEKLKSSRVSEIVVFIDELLSLSPYQKEAQKLSEHLEEVLKIGELIKSVETDILVACDTFMIIDKVILSRLAVGASEGRKDYEKWIRYAKERRSKHWYYVFENEYRAIIHGLELLKHYDQVSNRLSVENLDDYFDMYVSEYHKLDFHYRKFYHYFDQIQDKDLFAGMSEYIENVYVSSFLDTLSTNWSGLIDRHNIIEISGLKYKKQWHFYKDFVSQYVKNDERIFVIISDAMRYEIASELVVELQKERRAEIQLKALQGVVPSYTKFGMATLLPRSEMAYDKDVGITIDGVSTAGTKNREKILQAAHPDALAIRYDDVKHMKKSDYKDTLTGKKLVYIYHDTIDSYGHQGSPFDAAEMAIEELKDLLRALVNHVSATKVIITADHGFVYQRSKLVEYDKITKVKNDAVVETDRRYILSKSDAEDMNVLNLPFNPEINTKEPLKVIVPKGTIRFKTQGNDGNFVHGGAMLQEIVVPVIEYFDKRSDGFKAKKVEVQLTSITRKLTNRISYLEFFQTESVSVKNLPLNLKLYITDVDGNRVSNEVFIIADRDSSDPKDRSFKEKFVLKDLKYKKEDTYYLVLEDDEETINPILSKSAFTIDLAIVNDFGF
ncbi:MAG: BREX-1 system phosphatase PglZ type A [Clostridiales bacterium]|nr:BREX-1 system phosphatase PglZ type A [Clostridiales bacterium]